jgi:hypothetical protein
VQDFQRHPRHDFSAEVKSVLARRVAQHCSLCGQATSGPQADPRKTINTGVAAHITAASPGGPRYDASLAPSERSSPENGIWLCQSCGKLVDSDPDRYTVPLLRNLKRVAEAKVLASLENRSVVSDERADESSIVQRLAEIESALNKYLIAHRQYCSHLPYLSLNLGSLSKRLEDVYIPTRLSRLSQDSKTAGTNEVMTGELLVELDRHSLLILGPPGAGKSALLRQVALNAWHNPQKLGLHKPLLPILIPAIDLACSEGSLDARLRTVISNEYALDQELPEGFLNNWAKYVDTKWLLLIDGLDHIPEHKRARFLAWLGSLSNPSALYHVVLSCRSQAFDIVDSISSRWPYERFEICPLSTSEAVDLASNWIGHSMMEFQEQFWKIGDPELRATPLFATVAALVFREKGQLPSRRTQVYERFIALALEEARARGVEQQLHVLLARSLEHVLAMAATILTMGSRAELDRLFGVWLEGEFNLSTAEAKDAGSQFLRVMAEQSGLIYQAGNSFEYVHPTLQQYLCAKWFVSRSKSESTRVKGIAEFLLLHPALPECSVFFAGVLSDNPALSDAAMQAMYKRSRRRNWRFAYSDEALMSLYYSVKCLADGVIAFEQTRARILEHALNVVNSAKTDPSIRVVMASDLIALGEIAGLRESLYALFRDGHRSAEMRTVIIECLTKLRCSSDLVTIACDSSVDKSHRFMAASGLVDSRDIRSLVEILGRLGPQDDVSDQVFSHLVWLDPSDELQRYVSSPTSGEALTAVSCMLLASLGHSEKLFDVVCDENAPDYSRFCALPIVLKKYSKRKIIIQLTQPQYRAFLLAPSFALLIHFRNQWQRSDLSPGPEVMDILRKVLAISLRRPDLLREDGLNALALLDEAIARIQGELRDRASKVSAQD